MSSNTSIDLKPIIDEAKSVPMNEPVLKNELGFFHSAMSTMKSGAPAGPPVSSLPKSHLGDFLQRSTVISNGTLSSTDTFGTGIVTVDPWKAFLESTFIAPKIEAYKYIRGTMEVQISVNAPAGAYGMYYLVAIPFLTSNFTGSTGTIGLSRTGLETVPHIRLDLNTCTDGKVLLPWCHWNDYATLGDSTTIEGYTNMWALRVVCYQPIATATGTDTPQGTFRIWARCTSDHDMVIPYTQMMPSSFDAARDMASNEFDNTRNSVNSATEAVTGMKPSGIAGAIATGATAVAAAVPFLSPFAGPAAAIASGVSAVLSWFGFTRETAQQTPTTLVRRNYSNVANMDCDDTSEIAALSRDNAISIDPRFVAPSSEDEGAFNYLMSKWVLMGSAEWTPSQTAQTEIVSFPVTPFLTNASMQTGGSMFTMAGFLGFPFEYWRGDMEYKIVIPFSKFHRGVLQVSWTPDNSAPIVDITNTRFNHILDCSTCTEWQFTVGYANTIPMLENVPHLFDAAILSASGTNGTVSITVANPLTSPVETATTKIWVYARACPNMEFAIPRKWYRPLQDDGSLGSARDFATGFVLQMSSGAIGNDMTLSKSFNLVPGTTAPIKELCIGERFDSVRGLMQKFSQDMRIQRTVSIGTQDTYYIQHFPSPPNENQYLDVEPPSSDTTDTQFFTWAAYYSVIFTGLAASTRYKLVNNTGEDVAIGVSHRTASAGVASQVATSISSVSPIWSVANSEAVEITVPYYYNRKFMPTWCRFTANDIVDGNAVGRIDEINLFPLQSTTVTPNYRSLTGYVAYGPDIRLGMFRFPVRILQANASPEGWTKDLSPPG